MCASRIILGWVHDVFTIAYHMFMHFHAYVPYILYILIHWLCLVLFCVFLSSSLSLSLVYNSCVMAPKRKSTPSRNPLCFEASTSSDPTPSHVRFRDDKADRTFRSSRRAVHSKRPVILSDFSDTDLSTVIHSRGWESLCDIPVTCLSMLIQEFYSNMHELDSSVPLFHTRVQGTRIVVTPELVSDVLCVLRV